MVAVTQVVKSCSRALSRYLGMDSLLTRRLKNKNVFILPKLFRRLFISRLSTFFSRFKISGGFNLFSNYMLRGSRVQYPPALPTQTSRAFLQLALNIKLVYVPKLSLDGHSESVRQGISDFLAVLSPVSSPGCIYLCCCSGPDAVGEVWRVSRLSSSPMSVSGLTAVTRSSDHSQEPKHTQSRWFPESGARPCNVFLIEYDCI